MPPISVSSECKINLAEKGNTWAQSSATTAEMKVGPSRNEGKKTLHLNKGRISLVNLVWIEPRLDFIPSVLFQINIAKQANVHLSIIPHSLSHAQSPVVPPHQKHCGLASPRSLAVALLILFKSLNLEDAHTQHF